MTHACAGSLDSSAMQLNQMFDEGQAETKTAGAPLARHIALAKALEDVRQEIRIDALAGVTHDDLNMRIRAF